MKYIDIATASTFALAVGCSSHLSEPRIGYDENGVEMAYVINAPGSGTVSTQPPKLPGALSGIGKILCAGAEGTKVFVISGPDGGKCNQTIKMSDCVYDGTNCTCNYEVVSQSGDCEDNGTIMSTK